MLRFALFLLLIPALAKAGEPTYWQDVRPVLRKYCVACHNVRNLQEIEVSGGLALDTFEAISQPRKQKVLIPGKSQESSLYTRLVTKDDSLRMPVGGKALPGEMIALVKNWIDAGAREGSRPEELTTTAPTQRRKLEVAFATTARPPAGLYAAGNSGPLTLSLKVGPLSPVTALAFSPDGKLLATGSYGLVTIWDLQQVQPARTLTRVLGAVNDLRFSPDGKSLAVAGGQPSAKGDLRLFQVGDWKLLASLPGHEDVVSSVAFRADSKQLVSGSFDKTVRIWDLASHKTVQTLTGHSDFVYAVAFSPDGSWVASASKDRTVKIVDTGTGQSRLTLSGMNLDVLAVAISRDGKALVSSGYEPGIAWWNAQTGERVRTQAGHGVAVHELIFSADGKLLASAGGDATIRLFDSSTGAPVRNIAVASMAYAVALSPDSRLIAGGTFSGEVRLFETRTGKHLMTLCSTPSGTDLAEWLALTPEGYHAGSKGWLDQGRWTMTGRALTASGVSKALHRPELLCRAIRGETLPAPVYAK